MIQRSVVCMIYAVLTLSACSDSEREPGRAVSQSPSALIPRDVLFGNPQRVQPRISPDGRYLSYLAPHEGVMNIWIRSVGARDDRVVTSDRKRGIRGYAWAWDNRHLLYIQDRDGDENWHIYSVDLKEEGSAARDLTPFEGVQARFVGTSKKIPDKILVGLNKENPKAHDVYVLDLDSGELTLDTKNPGKIISWTPNDRLEVLAGTIINRDGGATIQIRDDTQAEWKPFITHGPDDTASIEAFSDCGKYAYVQHNMGTDKSCLYKKDLKTGAEELLFKPERADIGRVFRDQDTYEPLAVSTNYLRSEWHILDDSIEADFDALHAVREGDFSVINRDGSGGTWLVAYMTDDGPTYYYAYDRETRKASFLFTHRPELIGLELAKMKPMKIRSRDGLEMVCYLTLPPDREPRNLPMVLFVHGGPWSRDAWGFNPYHQWLADRGYAVLSVNFRGSSGFGKAFLNAGNRQWAAKMHDDLIDAKNWAVDEGYADKDRVAIMGGSYGGYAVLVAATFTPDAFCCGVDIFGPSNVLTLVHSIPPYWTPLINLFKHRVGDWEEDPEYFEEISPLFKVDRIKMPLLIGQGRNDARVKVDEALRIVEAARKNNKEVIYIEFPDEGHGFVRPENNNAFLAAVEKFLAAHLGGDYLPAIPQEKAVLDRVIQE